MLLCLDVGNSQIFGGLFGADDKLEFRFRLTSKSQSSDEFGCFLSQVLRENGVEPSLITRIGISSVVPHLDYSLRSACIKYFSITPFFLQHNTKMNLLLYPLNSSKLGADRIANGIAALESFPNENLIIIDFGTAITFCAIDAAGRYLGGSIYPGLRLMVEALAKNTALLPTVEVVEVEEPVATDTVSSIQSGIFFGTLGACKEIIRRFKESQFTNQQVKVLATGGFSILFEKQGLYDHHLPDLILQGIRIAVNANGV